MSDPVRVRPARPGPDGGERARLRQLQNRLATPWPALLTIGIDAAHDTVASALDAPGPACLVAIPDADAGHPRDRVVSTAVVGYALSIPGPTRLLVELVVAPEHRRRGIGRTLVARLADRGPLRVTVRADDDRARAFYDALGFEPVERLPAFYDLSDGRSVDGLALRLADGGVTDRDSVIGDGRAN